MSDGLNNTPQSTRASSIAPSASALEGVAALQQLRHVNERGLESPLSSIDRLGDLQVMHLKGSHQEIGLTHGRLLSAEIAECYKIYTSFWSSLSPLQVETFAKEQLSIIRGAFPHYAEEMEGIAAGSGMPLEAIVALNSRTELAHFNAKIERAKGLSNPQPHECTLVGDKSTAIMGQTWDWAAVIEPHTKLAHITLENGHEILTMTEPGILGKVGMNTAGIGVGLNFIPGTEAGNAGVPVHLLLRRCLEAHCLTEIHNMLMEMQSENLLCTMSAISVMDRSGNGKVYEILGRTLAFPNEEKARFFVHTNHPVLNPSGYGTVDLDDTLARFQDASTIASRKPLTVEGTQVLLNDRSNCNYSINMMAADWGTLGKVETIRSIILDLRNGEFHISKGAPGETDSTLKYETVRLYGAPVQ